MNPPNLPERLRDTRERAELTLRELAHRTGLNHNTIHKIEVGEQAPAARTLRRLAHALDVSLAYLNGESDNPGEAPAIHPASAEADDLARCAGALDAADYELLLRFCQRLQR